MELEMGETKQKHLYISRVEEKGMWMNETWEEPTQWLSITEIFYELVVTRKKLCKDTLKAFTMNCSNNLDNWLNIADYYSVIVLA